MTTNSKLFMLGVILLGLLSTPISMAYLTLQGLEVKYQTLDAEYSEKLKSGEATTTELIDLKTEEEQIIEALLVESKMYLWLSLIGSLVGFSLIAFYIIHNITNPLERYRHRLEALITGKISADELLDVNSTAELAGVNEIFGTYVTKVGVIQEYIKKPLAEELLFGRLAKGGVVRVELENGELKMTYPPQAPGKKKVEETVEG